MYRSGAWKKSTSLLGNSVEKNEDINDYFRALSVKSKQIRKGQRKGESEEEDPSPNKNIPQSPFLKKRPSTTDSKLPDEKIPGKVAPSNIRSEAYNKFLAYEKKYTRKDRVFKSVSDISLGSLALSKSEYESEHEESKSHSSSTSTHRVLPAVIGIASDLPDVVDVPEEESLLIDFGSPEPPQQKQDKPANLDTLDLSSRDERDSHDHCDNILQVSGVEVEALQKSDSHLSLLTDGSTKDALDGQDNAESVYKANLAFKSSQNSHLVTTDNDLHIDETSKPIQAESNIKSVSSDDIEEDIPEEIPSVAYSSDFPSYDSDSDDGDLGLGNIHSVHDLISLVEAKDAEKEEEHSVVQNLDALGLGNIHSVHELISLAEANSVEIEEEHSLEQNSDSSATTVKSVEELTHEFTPAAATMFKFHSSKALPPENVPVKLADDSIRSSTHLSRKAKLPPKLKATKQKESSESSDTLATQTSKRSGDLHNQVMKKEHKIATVRMRNACIQTPLHLEMDVPYMTHSWEVPAFREHSLRPSLLDAISSEVSGGDIASQMLLQQIDLTRSFMRTHQEMYNNYCEAAKDISKGYHYVRARETYQYMKRKKPSRQKKDNQH